MFQKARHFREEFRSATRIVARCWVASLLIVTTIAAAAPTIVQHPASQSALGGTNLTLHVVAQGESPLFYAWWKNDVQLLNETNASLFIPQVHTANYWVVVTNASGSVTSNVARISAFVVDWWLTIDRYSAGFSDGQFGFNTTGGSGPPILIEASTDFRNWVPVATNNAAPSSLFVRDPQSTNFPHRFYRMRQ